MLRFHNRRPSAVGPAASRARRMAALCGIALVLTSCGGGDNSDPAPGSSPDSATDSASTQPSADPADSLEGKPLVTYVTVTNAGGKLEKVATNITKKIPRANYAKQFSGIELPLALESNASSTNGKLFAQVVGIGCFEPDSLLLTKQTPPYSVKATFPKRDIQCFAPMTTVAFIAVPRAN